MLPVYSPSVFTNYDINVGQCRPVSESIIITSSKQVRNGQGPAASHQSSKGAVSWLWLPTLAGFISYCDKIFIKGTSYFPGKHRLRHLKQPQLLISTFFDTKDLYLPLCAPAKSHTDKHTTHTLKYIYVDICFLSTMCHCSLHQNFHSALQTLP